MKFAIMILILTIALVSGCTGNEIQKSGIDGIEPQVDPPVDLGLCQDLSHGDSYLAPDGCNYCTCNVFDDGTVHSLCTEIGCDFCPEGDCIKHTGEDLKADWDKLADGENNKGVIWVYFSDFNDVSFLGMFEDYIIYEEAGFVELIVWDTELDNVILLNQEDNFQGFFMNYILEEDEVDNS